MKMKNLIIILLVSLMVVLLSACSENPLIGEWEMIDEDGLVTSYEFKNNKDFVMKLSGLELSPYISSMTFDGTYKISKNTLTITMEVSATMDGDYSYEINDDNLTLTNSSGEKEIFTRKVK